MSISLENAKCDRNSEMPGPEAQFLTTEDLNQRLSLIPTLWSLVHQAHQGADDAAQNARQQLIERYGGAAHRYLRKVLGNPDAADEVAQEFALQIVHGKLGGADPERGRFRNFVKGTLFHLIADYRKQQRKWPGPLPDDGATVAAMPDDSTSDRAFVESWRDELLARTWSALAQIEAQTGQPYHAVLRFRADHPDLRSPQMAIELATQLGKTYTPVALRQTLHRAREQFAALLLDEVVHSLARPTAEQLQDELVELGLFEYCRPALERMGGSQT
jgi:DNA-directed RNA polymerase specialized sigma24 family protein